MARSPIVIKLLVIWSIRISLFPLFLKTLCLFAVQFVVCNCASSGHGLYSVMLLFYTLHAFCTVAVFFGPFNSWKNTINFHKITNLESLSCVRARWTTGRMSWRFIIGAEEVLFASLRLHLFPSCDILKWQCVRYGQIFIYLELNQTHDIFDIMSKSSCVVLQKYILKWAC